MEHPAGPGNRPAGALSRPGFRYLLAFLIVLGGVAVWGHITGWLARAPGAWFLAAGLFAASGAAGGALAGAARKRAGLGAALGASQTMVAGAIIAPAVFRDHPVITLRLGAAMLAASGVGGLVSVTLHQWLAGSRN